jgi:hypothetical protein
VVEFSLWFWLWNNTFILKNPDAEMFYAARLFDALTNGLEQFASQCLFNVWNVWTNAPGIMTFHSAVKDYERDGKRRTG